MERRWTVSGWTCPRPSSAERSCRWGNGASCVSRAARALEQEGDRGLYSPVALALDHEESRLVRGAQIGRVAACRFRPLKRGAFFVNRAEGGGDETRRPRRMVFEN